MFIVCDSFLSQRPVRSGLPVVTSDLILAFAIYKYSAPDGASEKQLFRTCAVGYSTTLPTCSINLGLRHKITC